MITAVVPAAALFDEIGDVPGVELVEVAPGEQPAERALGAEVIVFGAELSHLLGQLHSFERLRLIQTLNAGVDWLLPHVPSGVKVCNASSVHEGPVAEWVIGAILALQRELPRYFEAQARGEWDLDGNALVSPPDQITGDDLQGKTVLVVGYGAIGHAVEARLRPFGASVVGVRAHPGPGSHPREALPDLLPAADIVVLSCPLTDETRGMVDAGFLAALPAGAIVVNCSRGAIIDQGALLAELRLGRLRAALDVTDPEPLPAGHPLWSAPGVIVTPHTAGSVRRWMSRAYALAGDQLRSYANGEPLLHVRSSY